MTFRVPLITRIDRARQTAPANSGTRGTFIGLFPAAGLPTGKFLGSQPSRRHNTAALSWCHGSPQVLLSAAAINDPAEVTGDMRPVRRPDYAAYQYYGNGSLLQSTLQPPAPKPFAQLDWPNHRPVNLSAAHRDSNRAAQVFLTVAPPVSVDPDVLVNSSTVFASPFYGFS